MAVSFAYGSRGVTLNFFDHVGTPLAKETEFGKMMAAKKPYLNALAMATQPDGPFRGVRLLHHPSASMSKQLPVGCDYQDLAEDGYAMMQALESHGISTTYDPAAVTAAAGQTLRSYSDAELRQLLAGAVLLDAAAAAVLLERGFGGLIGMREVTKSVHRRELPWVLSAEEFHHPQFGGARRKYLSATLPNLGTAGKFSILTPAEGCEVLSSWVDPDTKRVAPAMTASENSLGGRVVVHGMDYASAFGVDYCHPFRREQLHGVVRWLSAGALELLFDCDGAFPLVWRKSAGADTEIIGGFNLSLDDWNEVEFQLAWPGALPQAHCLDGHGNWQTDASLTLELAGGILTLRYTGAVSYHLPLVIRLTR